MRPGCKHVDLIGKKTQKAATTVEVSGNGLAEVKELTCVCDGCNFSSLTAVLVVTLRSLKVACKQGQLIETVKFAHIYLHQERPAS